MAYKQKNPILKQMSYGPSSYDTPAKVTRKEIEIPNSNNGFNPSEINNANKSFIGGVDGVENEKVDVDPVKANKDASATPANKDLENALKENISSGNQTEKIKSLTEKSRDASLSPRKRYKASKKLLNKKSKYEDKQQLMEKKLEKDKIIRAGKDEGKDKKFAEKAEDYKKNNKYIEAAKVAAEADKKEQAAIHAYNNQGSMPGDGFGSATPTPNSQKSFDLDNTADYQMNQFNPRREKNDAYTFDNNYTKRGKQPPMTTKNMKQLNRKGHAIPYIEQPMIGAQSNRAGAGINRNVLTNTPLNVMDPTDPNYKKPSSISLNTNNEESKFSEIASSAGTTFENPSAPGAPAPGGATNTPNTPNAGIDQTFAGNAVAQYDPEKKATGTEEGKHLKTGTRVNGTKEYYYGEKRVDEKTYNELMNKPGQPGFNSGIKNAMEGKTGAFADMVANAPGMHTKVTGSNYKSAEKDDAAHASYLKRDVKDVQRSDMSQHKKDEYETADEKHISKLYGDLKYDHKHHGRKYDNV